MIFLALISLLLPPGPSLEVDGGAIPDPLGYWTGWLYLDDGDVPVRVSIAERDGRARAAVDLPAAGQQGVEFAFELASTDRARLRHPVDGDAGVLLELGPGQSDDHLAGSVDWHGVAGRVDLHRAPRALLPADPARADELAGIWGDAPGLILRATFWGDLVLSDPLTGAERTLFREGSDRWFSGGAYYVASPVEREFVVERGPDGEVVALIESAGERRVRRTRTPLVEETVLLERDGVRLVGTLTLVDDPLAPCVVVAGGSSWSDRSSVSRYAGLLAALGFSSLTYDKRGHGESSGYEVVPFETTAEDLVAFAEKVREHPALGLAPVGYLGISRGGWYGAQAAAKDERCAFFVDLVGPGVSPALQETRARLDRMREAGADRGAIELGQEYLARMWELARTGEGGDEYARLRERVRAAGWLGILGGPEPDDREDWEWSRLNAHFDPLPALRSITAPTLAVLGGADLSVSAEVSAPLLREALSGTGSVIVVPGVDHGLRPVRRDSDGERERFHRSPGTDPRAWRDIARFLDGRRP